MTTSFFSQFPTVAYDIAGNQYSNYELVTNIFFRLRIIQEALQNITAYYEFVIPDGETPEILADKVYGDSGYHWVILLANNIKDAQYDWPLDTRTFNKYIKSKYGSISSAKTQIHHYEMVITREESSSGKITETRFQINQDKLTDNELSVPFPYWTGLPEDQLLETINFGDGKTVVQKTFRDAITVWDYEQNINESKRTIKIIRPEFLSQIIQEFRNLTEAQQEPFLRRLV